VYIIVLGRLLDKLWIGATGQILPFEGGLQVLLSFGHAAEEAEVIKCVDSLGLGDGTKQSCHLVIAFFFGLQGEGEVPLMGLGFSDEALLKILQGIHPLYPRDPMRDQLFRLRTAEGATLRFMGGKLYMVTVGAFPQGAIYLLLSPFFRLTHRCSTQAHHLYHI
jgi:hypothetical protein